MCTGQGNGWPGESLVFVKVKQWFLFRRNPSQMTKARTRDKSKSVCDTRGALGQLDGSSPIGDL